MAAKNILQVAERVEKALSETQNIQKSVNDGIFATSQNIVDANNSLTKVRVHKWCSRMTTTVIRRSKLYRIVLLKNVQYNNTYIVYDNMMSFRWNRKRTLPKRVSKKSRNS